MEEALSRQRVKYKLLLKESLGEASIAHEAEVA